MSPPPIPASSEALLVVDTQFDFCDPRGSCFVAGAPACIPRVARAVEAARRRGVAVLWVVRAHDPSGDDVELFRRDLFADGGPGVCVRGSRGAEQVAPLAPGKEEQTVVKTRFSGFFRTPLGSILRRRGISAVTVCGVQLPNCVRGTAVDALGEDFWPIRVLADAVASADDDVHRANLHDLRAMHVETLTVDEWTQRIDPQA